MGMGGNGVTQSALFNPSLITYYDRKVIHTEYMNRYGLKELATVRVGFIYPNRLLTTGVDIVSFGYDKYRESMIRMSVGKQLSERWRVGVSIQYWMVQTELTEEVPQQLATDIGAVYSPVDKLLIGVLITDFPSVSLSSEKTENKYFTGYSVQIGFQWEVINNLLIVGQAASNRETTLTGSAGVAYSPFDRFQIRAGITGIPFLPALGVGYRFSRFTIDAAAQLHPLLGVSTGLGLSYTF